MAPRILPLPETQPTEEDSIKAHRLEPDEGKLSYPVLRGGGGREAASLPDEKVPSPGLRPGRLGWLTRVPLEKGAAWRFTLRLSCSFSVTRVWLLAVNWATGSCSARPDVTTQPPELAGLLGSGRQCLRGNS